MEDSGAGCDRDGVGVQKAALEVGWRRGLETRLWEAYLVGGKDQEKAAAEVSRVLPSHMCLPVRGHGLPRELPTEVGTGSATGPAPQPGMSSAKTQQAFRAPQCFTTILLFTKFFIKKNGQQGT